MTIDPTQIPPAHGTEVFEAPPRQQPEAAPVPVLADADLDGIGRLTWVIAEGYIPSESNGPEPAMTSHETACILNTNDEPAAVQITVFFADREPVGPYKVRVPARRTLHLRFNGLEDPEPIPRDTDYSSVIRSSLPIVVQHTRLDSRQPPHALLSTVAWAE
jgi:hypothetical protein